jgi:hypothetical protein
MLFYKLRVWWWKTLNMAKEKLKVGTEILTILTSDDEGLTTCKNK